MSLKTEIRNDHLDGFAPLASLKWWNCHSCQIRAEKSGGRFICNPNERTRAARPRGKSPMIEMFPSPVWVTFRVKPRGSWSYELFPQRSTVLSSRLQAGRHMFASASLSSIQQHLVISVLNINTVVMCGGLFILSHRSVSLKLNQFCRRGDPSPGLSGRAVHLGRGLLGPCALLWFGQGFLLVIGVLLSAYLTTVFTDGV